MTHKSIPTVVAALFATALSAWTEPAAAQIPPSVGWTAQQAPAFYRFHLGNFRMTVLSDGTASRDLSKIMSKPDAVRSAFWASHETLPVELSINCFLIDTGVQKILVDAGAGELFGSMSGRLVVNLRASGYQPEDIDAILLTHIHGDHSGGLSIGGRRIFPNAFVYVDQRDASYWLSIGVEATAPANRKTTFAQSHQTEKQLPSDWVSLTQAGLPAGACAPCGEARVMTGIVTATGDASTRFVVISCLVAARTPAPSPATTKPASTKRTPR